MPRTYYKQEKVNTCVVAAVRTVLALQFGVRIKEPALEALGQSAEFPIAKHGASTGDMRQMVKGASRAYNVGKPWTVRVVADGNLSELRSLTCRGKAVICRVNCDPDGFVPYHVVVVLKLSKYRIRLFDPADPNATPKNMTYEAFVPWWTGALDGKKWYATIGGGSQSV